MNVLLLRAKDVALACPMEEAIAAVDAGFRALSTGQATTPVRLSVPINKEGVALTMPASLAGAPWCSVKVVSVAPGNRSTGRPLVTGTVLLIDASSGDLVALIEGATLTALRTGAAGGVAARTLARPGATVTTLFGAGAQARTQLLGLVAVRPIRLVRVVTRDPAHAAAFCRWAADEPRLAGISVQPAPLAEALDGTDVVVTATTSAEPVFPGALLPSGVHITAVGSFTPAMRELDDDAMRGARVVVDQRAAALAEAGELRGLRPSDVAEIGEVLTGAVPGRTTEAERTIFKSVGNAIQDLAVATRAFEGARAQGLGELIDFP